MLMKHFKRSGALAGSVLRQQKRVALIGLLPSRPFSLPKYQFQDEEWVPDRFQLSAGSHKSNAEELINALPVVEVTGDTARCTGVNELGLGHPVQYIQLNRRHEHTPATCKWCGLRFRKAEGDHHGHH